jgi:hypothetical protein
MGDHLCTCTSHSGAKKDHEWVVNQIADLFHTTHTSKTRQTSRIRGQYCGDVELTDYLANSEVQLSLNESDVDKIRKYHVDYNNNPPNSISFMSVIASTSGRIHSEFVRLLFIQVHRETNRFFAVSGVQLEEPTSGQCHFRRTHSLSTLDQRLVISSVRL